jgi:hypothetical protein
MAIQAIPEVAPAWRDLMEWEQSAAEIPLPAIDSIQFERGAPRTVLLTAPNRVPGATVVSADPERMELADRVAASALAAAIGRCADIQGGVSAIWHQGGLDYEIYGDNPSAPTRLSEQRADDWMILWGMIHQLAQITAKYIDFPNSAHIPTPNGQQ